jgi:hypothetical protein
MLLSHSTIFDPTIYFCGYGNHMGECACVLMYVCGGGGGGESLVQVCHMHVMASRHWRRHPTGTALACHNCCAAHDT